MNDESKPWVLVVEDDFENQKFLKIFLQRRFNVDVCDSADTCYEQMAKQEFDLLIMDISLRGKKDGLQLTKELRSNDTYKNLPIVCLSAHAFQRDKDNAYNAGVDVFITKPVQNHILLAAILKVLKDRRGIDLE
jgi:DNA-binding response OmpR family regulator